jgi:hypothetical protein
MPKTLLPLMVLLETVSVPPLKMPPPASKLALLPVIMVLSTVSLPTF